MAVLAIFTGDLNKSQYEQLRKEVNWEGQQPPGGVLHAAGFDDSGRIHVADVWESAEAMNAFVEQRLMPAYQAAWVCPARSGCVSRAKPQRPSSD